MITLMMTIPKKRSEKMELYQEILIKFLVDHYYESPMQVFDPMVKDIVEWESYTALCSIREIIQNEKFSDFECYEKVEAIINALEEIGSTGGERHGCL